MLTLAKHVENIEKHWRVYNRKKMNYTRNCTNKKKIKKLFLIK
jgi:hypothetical protein